MLATRNKQFHQNKLSFRLDLQHYRVFDISFIWCRFFREAAVLWWSRPFVPGSKLVTRVRNGEECQHSENFTHSFMEFVLLQRLYIKKYSQTVSVNKTPSLRGSIMLVSYTYGNVIHDVENIISSQKYQKILVI